MAHPTPVWLKKFEFQKGQSVNPETQFKKTAEWTDLPCKVCGKLVHLTVSKAEKYWGGTCSKKCANDLKRTGKSIRKECICGKIYYVTPCHEGTSKFCSYKCKGNDRRKSWTGTDKHLRNSWQYNEWKQKVNTRDNFTCQDCGKEHSQIAHHIKMWHEHPELRFEVSNGITICRACHIQRHENEVWTTNLQFK